MLDSSLRPARQSSESTSVQEPTYTKSQSDDARVVVFLSRFNDQATQAGLIEFPGFFRRNCRIRKKMRLGFP